MNGERVKCARGMTLVEVLVAGLMASVVAAGALSYEYHAARQIRGASARASAVQIGYFLLEDWKANGGSELYANNVGGVHNPGELMMGFNYIGGGVYQITVDNISMQITLSRDSGYLRLIPLTVTVQYDTGLGSKNPSVVLNTYARIDQTGG